MRMRLKPLRPHSAIHIIWTQQITQPDSFSNALLRHVSAITYDHLQAVRNKNYNDNTQVQDEIYFKSNKKWGRCVCLLSTVNVKITF